MLKKERLERLTRILLRPEYLSRLSTAFDLGVGPISASLNDGGEDNLVLVLADEEGRRFAVARHYLATPATEIEAELGFVRFLAENGFPTPAPIATRDGASFLAAPHAPSVALFPFVHGGVTKWLGAQLSGAPAGRLWLRCMLSAIKSTV